jgi:hypothetical protein
MARWMCALCLLLACATGPEKVNPQPNKLDPHNPGDNCIDTCPEGMICTGTSGIRWPKKKVFPGRCELKPGRCAGDVDCHRSARCVRTSDDLGLCAEAPQL